MYSVTRSFGLKGLNGFAVAVEADVSGGLPAFSIVGLPDSAVRESADRVRAAIKNLGFKFPDRRITINLAPADVRKTGPVYDLPLLLALLISSGQLEAVPSDAAFLGELALDGTLRPVSGVLPMALAAAESGIRALYVPAENAAEAAEACPLPPLSPLIRQKPGHRCRILRTYWASLWRGGPWSLPLPVDTTFC